MNDQKQDFPARLIYQPVAGFVEQVASKAPAPGGGSVAALAGSLGAALLTMVANLTVGKKNYASVADRFIELRAHIETLRAQLTERIDDDTAAFNRMRAAGKLPERDDAEKRAKETEMAAATKQAVEVPESTMSLCLQALDLAPEVAENGNVNTVSDAGTAAEMLLAGLEGAAANVLINLPGLPADQAPAYRKKVEDARRRGRSLLDDVRRVVGKKLVA
ncbi:MAG: cyclodeaminase/cyclohydrolase family protein [bacterium]|nr:cyclodeaminase/cyclohydrolase family protein [bacterium]